MRRDTPTPRLSPVPGPPSPPIDAAAAFPIPALHRRPVAREERAALRQPVYVIRCAHCDTFFTDRGMKAVLLLKPHVTLFSTDAMPSDCAAMYAPDPLLGDLPDPPGAPKERTCNCLTQTLGCQGCGSVVGYNVVSPCSRCSSNVSRHSKGHNGHRIVFHCADIAAHERRYLPGDRGVRCMSVPPILSSLMKERDLVEQQLHHIVYENKADEMQQCLDESDDHDNDDDGADDDDNDDDGADDDGADDDNCLLPTEQAACTVQRPEWHAQHGEEYMRISQRRVCIQQEMRSIYARLLHEYQAGARMLLAGETIYWSDLSEAGGERTQPFDPEPYLALPMAGR